METEAKCKCNTCSQPISFPVTMAGQMTDCPHCNLQTLLFIPGSPPPKNIAAPIPSAPVPRRMETVATSHPASVAKPVGYLFSLFLQSLSAAGIITLVILAARHELAAQKKINWDYSAFEFTPHPDRAPDGQPYRNMLVYMDWDKSPLDLKESGSEEEISLDGTLSTLGADGWQLAWTDGTKCIVKRPDGRWWHSTFYTALREEKAETKPANP